MELSNTYYRAPMESQAAAWAARVPADFRFAVKLQRDRSRRAYTRDPAAVVPELTRPLVGFGGRLGTALLRVTADLPRDDERLARLLDAWPQDVPLALELQHSSWNVDEVHAALRARRAVLVVTETDDAPEPPLTATGPFVYVRLRRSTYGTGDLDAWAARLEPFLADGRDAFAFFRHDDDGRTPGLAADLAARLPGFDPRR